MGKGKGKRCSTLNGRNKFFIDMVNTHDCDFRIIANELNESDAFTLEIETIKYYRDNFPQYRLTNQTDGGEGVSGWDATPEYRNHMRKINTGSGNPNYNNKWSVEQKQHLSLLRKNLKLAAGAKNPKAKQIMCLETGEIFHTMQDAMLKYNIKDQGNITIVFKQPHRTAGRLHWVCGDLIKTLDTLDKRVQYIKDHCIFGRCKPLICIETKQVYASRKILSEREHINYRTVLHNFEKYSSLKHNNKTYIYLIDYGRYM